MERTNICYVFANFSLLSFSLISDLLKEKCEVIVVTNHKETFAKYFSNYPNIEFRNFKEKLEKIPAYIFLIQGISTQDAYFSKVQIKSILKFSEDYMPKTQVVLPYVVNGNRRIIEWIAATAKKINNRNLGIGYIGQTYGEGMELVGGMIPEMFTSIWKDSEIIIPRFDLDIYIISAKEASRELIKGMFSYGFGKKEVVISKKLKVFMFLKELQKIFPSARFMTREIPPNGTVANFDFVKLGDDLPHLKETVEWLLKNRKKGSVQRIKTKRITPKANLRILFLSIFVFGAILLLPYLSFFVSMVTLKIGFQRLTKADLGVAGFSFRVADGFAIFSKAGFETLNGLPYVGKFFSYSLDTSLELDAYAKVGEKSEESLALAINFKDKIFGSQNYDVKKISQELYLDLNGLYEQFSFLEAETKNMQSGSFFAPDINMYDIRRFLFSAKEIAKNMPQLLGDGGKTSYALVLQDKNELRPSGGAISAVGVFNFSDGKFTGNSFYDIKQLDSQLRGLVAPPFILKKYLGINTWSLKDANWSSDFEESGNQIDWFLQKELGQNIDGLLAVDSSFYGGIKNVTDLLTISGQIIKGFRAKDLEAYTQNTDVMDALKNLNWDGNASMQELGFGLVEANLGFTKNNISIERNANLTIESSGDIFKNKLVLDFTNSSSQTYRNYLRVLSPLGSNFGKVAEIINGKTEFLTPDVNSFSDRTEAGILVQVPAKGKVQLEFDWNINKTAENGLIYVRKQPGVDIMPTSIVINGKARYNTNLTTDFVLSF